MIIEYKKEKLQHDISQLPDHIVGRAEYLKDYFDRNVYEVVEESLNPLIDELAGTNGARNIGAAAFSVIPAGTVQSQLQGLKALMDHAAWGIPDSCGTDIIQDKAVIKEKLSDDITERLHETFYSADCSASEGGFFISGEIPDTVCTVRFIAAATYIKSDTLTVNGDSYTLTMTNGKALPDHAWIAGAVVNLQLDPANKKAFFSSGSPDLDVITATAEHIVKGYVGIDSEGEPVHGTAIKYIEQTIALNPTVRTYIDDDGYRYYYFTASVTLPFVPDSFDITCTVEIGATGISGNVSQLICSVQRINGTYYVMQQGCRYYNGNTNSYVYLADALGFAIGTNSASDAVIKTPASVPELAAGQTYSIVSNQISNNTAYHFTIDSVTDMKIVLKKYS